MVQSETTLPKTCCHVTLCQYNCLLASMSQKLIHNIDPDMANHVVPIFPYIPQIPLLVDRVDGVLGP